MTKILTVLAMGILFCSHAQAVELDYHGKIGNPGTSLSACVQDMNKHKLLGTHITHLYFQGNCLDSKSAQEILEGIMASPVGSLVIHEEELKTGKKEFLADPEKMRSAFLKAKDLKIIGQYFTELYIQTLDTKDVITDQMQEPLVCGFLAQTLDIMMRDHNELKTFVTDCIQKNVIEERMKHPFPGLAFVDLSCNAIDQKEEGHAGFVQSLAKFLDLYENVKVSLAYNFSPSIFSHLDIVCNNGKAINIDAPDYEKILNKTSRVTLD